eukprot:CAMPEP_0201552670 /NCGR_PEP_ID=MMETSP0173_2-20130828/16843_1 /ASSEMBLY_ACC=CAM_ASM_000268 /TAXON_ID=218659 /ORGANISM="Vexillifera sp., Strain DIVA3 564/2" /LENGTH=603 /DNA_ID=CAMNT_0047963183 /DNA_START=6 /DNA_END=1817 /DNA_ORIENTATION=-
MEKNQKIPIALTPDDSTAPPRCRWHLFIFFLLGFGCFALSLHFFFGWAYEPQHQHSTESSARPDFENLCNAREFSQTRLLLPEDWMLVNSKIDISAPFELNIALRMRNLDKLNQLFWEVSDPHSSTYGMHLTRDELRDIVSPSSNAIQEVIDWIKHSVGEASANTLLFDLTHSNDWLRVHGLTIGQVQTLLHLRFASFVHIESGVEVVRSLDAYLLPCHIVDHIDLISGIRRFPSFPQKPLVHENADSAMAAFVTPKLIHNWYNISDTVGKSANNLQAVAQFLEQYYSPSDFTKFMEKFADQANATQPTVVGANNPSKPGVEATLDIEYISSTALDVPTVFQYTHGRNHGQEPFLQWLMELGNSTNPPLMNSVSYGDVESSLERTYMERCNNEFKKFGSLGISIFFASGDSGVGCSNGHTVPNFPASSPYVTAVGATHLVTGTFGKQIEEGVKFSGGGFSNVFAAESYQHSAVQHYLNTTRNLPSSNTFNASGRCYPDISSFGVNFAIIIDGLTTGVSGTSAACPTAAGIFSLVNDQRLQRGQSPLGFANPLIYHLKANVTGAFNPISIGQNSHAFCQGFPASPDYSPAFGVGSPNFEVLKNF